MSGFDLARFFLELLAVVASAFALAVFRFPPFVLFLAASIYFFVADLLSNGGDWTAILSILIGLVFLAAAVGIDLGESSHYGLWLHVRPASSSEAGCFGSSTTGRRLHPSRGHRACVHGDRGRARALELDRARRVGAPADRRAFRRQWFRSETLTLLLPAVPSSRSRSRRSRSSPCARMGRPSCVRGGGALFMAVALFLARRRRDSVPVGGLIWRDSRIQGVRIGVLALQGNFREHARRSRLGVEAVEVRRPEHLDGLDGLVVPGGESTAIGRLMRHRLLRGAGASSRGRSSAPAPG